MSPPPSNRHHHPASKYYVFCKIFIDEQAASGRRFRTDKQGMESAALKWNSTTSEEKDEWNNQRYYEEKKKNDEKEDNKKKPYFCVRNGERGDPTADPVELSKLANLETKSKADIDALVMRWSFMFDDNRSAIASERFLLVTALSPADAKPTTSFSELALIEFSLAKGVLDEFRVDFANYPPDDEAAVKMRYESIRIVLDWPSKLRHRLGVRLPVFFVPNGRMRDVFNALTYVDPSTPDWPPLWSSKPQVSLATDLASIGDFRSAMAAFFGKPRPSDAYDVIKRVDTDDDEENGIAIDCLDDARLIVQGLIDEFGQ